MLLHGFVSQVSADLSRELPPLQSMSDLTSAAEPPLRDGEVRDPAKIGGQGLRIADGKGVLADGTQ